MDSWNIHSLDRIADIQNAAEQVRNKLKSSNLDTVFVSTDAPIEEFEEFKNFLPEFKVAKFIPDKDVLNDFKDGGVAIIDQSICSRAR